MEFTGERVIPGKTDPDLFNEHLARYRFAETLASGRRVLDAGCGAGYGTALLAERAESACGIDQSQETVRWAKNEYGEDKASFTQADCSAFPFRDGSFDLVTAFEIIEHLPDWKGLLLESRRVLTDNGQLLVSTPNRLYSEESRAEPNEFHVHEFDHAEFKQELESVFPHVTMFFENHTQAIAFQTPDLQGVRTVMGGGPPEPADAHFFFAVCSGQPQFGAPAFLYVPTTGNVLKDREQHVALLEQEVKTKSAWLDKATRELEAFSKINLEMEAELADKIAWARSRDEEITQAAAKIDELEARVKDREQHVALLEQEVKTKSAWLDKATRELEAFSKINLEMEAELADKIAWARSRDEEITQAAAKIDELEARVIERTAWAKRAQEQLDKTWGWRAYRLARKLGIAPVPPDPKS